MSFLYLPSSSLVSVGTFGKSIGLKGGIRVFLLTDFSEILRPGAAFYIDYNDALYKAMYPNALDSINKDSIDKCNSDMSLLIPIRIQSYNATRSLMILKEINNRDHANLLRNMAFYSTIDETKELCKLQKDEFFYFDIIGMMVIDDGLAIGEVIDILHIGNVYYFMLSDNFLIPYIDRYVINIDINSKTIHTKDAISLRT